MRSGSDLSSPPHSGAGIRRRAFLAAAGGAAVAAATPAWLRSGGSLRAAAAAVARPRRFKTELPIPRVLTGSDITIRMRPARLRILPGRRTRMWTYGGSFPGPTIRRPAGQETRVRFVHELPRRAGELTVHLHGGHNTAADDGQPGGLTAAQPRSLYCDISPRLDPSAAGNDLLIPPGGERTYTYGLTEDGQPERAAFQWYHDHRLDRTGRNVWRGLAGMWIIDDELDRPGGPLGLPAGDRDIPLLIADRAFNARNQLTNPFPGLRPPDDGVTGKHVLVNGAIAPFHRVRARRYRLRLLNASNFRSYNVYLTGDVPLTQIATEAGLMPRPLRRNRVLIGPGERVELVADFSRARGRTVQLRSGRRRDGARSLGSKPYLGALMEFRVGDRRVPDATRVPAELRPLPGWTSEVGFGSAAEHVWRVTVEGGVVPRWTINGETYDPARVEATATEGQVVVWELQNRTGVAHMMHLHQTDWYMLRRRARGASEWKRPRPWERCLKETFFMDPGERIVVAGKPSDHLGRFVVHCHMLDHEDHGLMSQFEVVPAA